MHRAYRTPTISTDQVGPSRSPRSVGILILSWLLGASVLTGSLCACQAVERVTGPLQPAWTGPKVEGMFQSEPEMRIRVQRNATSLDVRGAGKVVVRHAGAGTIRAELLTTPVKVASGAGGVVTTDAGGVKREWGFGNNIELLSSDGHAEGVVSAATSSLMLGPTSYPGVVTIMPSWSSEPRAFDVIVSMGVETYLPGVLTHELFKDWPRQTYEAQAIAARTYALHERSRARSERRAFDVEDTDFDQVYGGATKHVIAQEAVRSTRGQVLAQDGRLIRAYYSSTCGGRPASASVTWPLKPGTEFNLAPALQGREREWACQPATFYRWSVTRNDEELSRRIRAWATKEQHPAASLTRVRRIEVRSRNDALRPNTYSITDANGRTFEMTAEELRTSSNWSVPDAPPITRDTRVHSGDFDVTVWADQVRFNGRGWGHGVGMCQWCAKGFADQGWDRSRMLRVFYPGADVVRAY